MITVSQGATDHEFPNAETFRKDDMGGVEVWEDRGMIASFSHYDWVRKDTATDDRERTETLRFDFSRPMNTDGYDPNRPADQLIDVDPDATATDPCGCNQPEAVHERGDAGRCLATLNALGS